MKRLVALLPLMLILLASCTSEEAPDPAAQDTAKDPTVYPLNAEAMVEGIDSIGEPPSIIFTTPASENGLGDTMYKIIGTVEDVILAEQSDTKITTVFVSTKDGKIAVSDPASSILLDTPTALTDLPIDIEAFKKFFALPQKEDFVCMYVQYQGFSEVLQCASAVYGGAGYLTQVTTLSMLNAGLEAESPATEPEAPAAPLETPAPPAPTTGEKNALSKAKDYLDYTAFSYSGLIEQLEFEGYSNTEATYGANNCGADWNVQAAKKAEDYMNYSSFSRSGLVDQLVYEGFTQEQAAYGATAVGY